MSRQDKLEIKPAGINMFSQEGDRLNHYTVCLPLYLSCFHIKKRLPYGAVTVFAIKVTAVCANALPLSVAPVFIEISV